MKVGYSYLKEDPVKQEVLVFEFDKNASVGRVACRIAKLMIQKEDTNTLNATLSEIL